MITLNNRMYLATRYYGGGGMPKPPAPPIPPDPQGAAVKIKEKNYGRNKMGRAQTILGGAMPPSPDSTQSLLGK